MKGQDIIILFKQGKVYLTEDKPMNFKQIGLAEYTTNGFKSSYWLLRVINHNEIEKKLFCEVLAYQLGEAEFGINQKKLSSKLKEIETVKFKSIETNGLLKTLSRDNSGSFLSSQNFTPDIETYNYKRETIVGHTYKQTITETFDVSIKNVRFIHGGVSFEKKLQRLDKSIEFKITNDDIIEEFDAVKNYFANILKTKKIQVIATIELEDGNILSIGANSPEIEKINKNLIDNVKFEFVKAIMKNSNLEMDKSIHTMDEYFDTFANEKINPFYNSEMDFFNDIISISNSQHYKHLRYLSSKHSHNIMKLRFIHKPFSFIFLLQGERNDHIIWETLDTKEATYVWHTKKDIKVLKSTLGRIEDIINIIKVQGKMAYLNTVEETFRRIYHDYSEFADGFVKWKEELEDCIT